MAENTKNDEPEIIVSEESAGLAEDTVSFISTDGRKTVKIHKHFCKGCEICAEICPKTVLHMTFAPDRWEGTVVDVIDINACTGCMLCEYQCPDFAIEVISIKKKKKKGE